MMNRTNKVFILIFFSLIIDLCSADQQQGALWQWMRKQEEAACDRKLQRNAYLVVGGTARQLNMSPHDREQAQKIIMALHELAQSAGDANTAFRLREKGGYGTAFTDLKELFEDCDDKDDVIDIVDAVYQGAPGLEFCIHRDISRETRDHAVEQVVTQIQLIQAIKGLDEKEKAALIGQMKAQGQEELIETVEGIHSLPDRKARAIIGHLAATGLHIKDNGITRTDMGKWNKDYASWLQFSAQSLNPGAPVVRDASKELAAAERASRRYIRLRGYDHAIERMEQELMPAGGNLIRQIDTELVQANYPTPEDYQVLGVTRWEPEPLADIRQKMFRLSRATHPDKTDDYDTTARMAQINGAFERIKNLRVDHERIKDPEFCHWRALTRDTLEHAVPDHLAKLKAEREAYARVANSDEAFRFHHRYLPAPTLTGKKKSFPLRAFGVQPFIRRGFNPAAHQASDHAAEESRRRATPASDDSDVTQRVQQQRSLEHRQPPSGDEN